MSNPKNDENVHFSDNHFKLKPTLFSNDRAVKFLFHRFCMVLCQKLINDFHVRIHKGALLLNVGLSAKWIYFYDFLCSHDAVSETLDGKAYRINIVGNIVP